MCSYQYIVKKMTVFKMCMRCFIEALRENKAKIDWKSLCCLEVELHHCVAERKETRLYINVLHGGV